MQKMYSAEKLYDFFFFKQLKNVQKNVQNETVHFNEVVSCIAESFTKEHRHRGSSIGKQLRRVCESTF
jgi:hypothetical protein